MQISRRALHAGLAGSVLASLAGGRSFAAAKSADRSGAHDPLALVDPELRASAAAQLAQPLPMLTVAGLPALRASWAAPEPLAPPAPAVDERFIPGLAGQPEVAVQVIGGRKDGRPRPAILHIHGGGFISGRARNLTPFCQDLATRFDCLVVNVDYRLSPETAYPGAVQDNYAALKWLYDNAAELGVDRSRIAVMGESAGGGHAALVAIAARDRGEISLCLQVLLYPMLDDRTGSREALPPHIGAIGWTAAANAFGWTAFLGAPAGSAQVPAGAVPARVQNLRGLAPAFIGVGAIDLFVDEDIEYARRLIAAGTPTTLVVAPGAYHAFDFVVPEARVSRDFTQAWRTALATAFAEPVPA
jgi:acetyl esterase/lipase